MSSRKGFSINGASSETPRGQHSVAHAALRKAGLAGASITDGDTGMRELSSAGPSRSRGSGSSSAGGAGSSGSSSSRRGGGANAGGGSSRMRVDPIAGNTMRARDRANPMGGRPPAAGSAAAKGNGKNRQQGTGRVPGGGGGGAGGSSSSANPLAADGGEFTAGKAISAIKRFFAPRWNAEAKFLNLEAMYADPILKEERIPAPGQSGAPSKLTSVMWKLAGDLYPDITTLSVANNNFKTVAPLLSLPDYLPNLQNLSLEGNQIQWAKDLTGLAQNSSKGKNKQRANPKAGTTPGAAGETNPASSRLRLPNLKELILVGNPVHETAISVGNEEGYRQEIISRFPTLTMLDRKPVSQIETDFAKLPTAGGSGGAGSVGPTPNGGLSAAANTITGNSKSRRAGAIATLAAAGAGVEPKNFPVEMKEGFVDPAAQTIVPDFLSKYFSLYDTSRSNLLPAYAQSARISVTTNFTLPPRAKVEGWQHSKEMPNQKSLGRDMLAKKVTDRNLMRRGTKIPHLSTGHKDILDVLSRLPKTTHPLQDASKFVFDAWLVPNAGVLEAVVGTNNPAAATGNVPVQGETPAALLWIQVHGQFAESPSEGVRSFDRLFLVAPVTPGSEAANAGWPCVILSDLITFRHFSHPKAWAPNSIPVGDGSAALAATAAAPMGSTGHSMPVVVAGGSGSGTSASVPQQAGPSSLGQPNSVVGAGAPAVNLAALPPHLQNQAPAPGLNEQQHALSLQLAAATRLTYPFAVQCLQENGWDPALAMGNFEALKAAGAIPAEAFVP